jgi:hypothetical protein
MSKLQFIMISMPKYWNEENFLAGEIQPPLSSAVHEAIHRCHMLT